MTTQRTAASIFVDDGRGHYNDSGLLVQRQYKDSVVFMVTNGSTAMTQRVWPEDMQAVGEWLIRTARALQGHTELCDLPDGHTGSCSEPVTA
jgi:hypothetical protein